MTSVSVRRRARAYNDSRRYGATDNIDGDLQPTVPTSNVNTAVVGSYTVTYNVTDFAGNEALPVVPHSQCDACNAGRGGGGGGAFELLGDSRCWSVRIHLLLHRARHCSRAARVEEQTKKDGEDN